MPADTVSYTPDGYPYIDASAPAPSAPQYVAVEHDPFDQSPPVAPTEPPSGLGIQPDQPWSSGFKPIDKLFGLGGEDRYQLWPERMIRSGVSLPGDVASGKYNVTPSVPGQWSDSDESRLQANDAEIFNRTQDLAGLAMSGTAFSARPSAGEFALGAGPMRQAQPEAAPALYSAVEKTIADLPLQKATPDQWLATIRQRPGVKQEELDWTGLPEWLGEQKEPVTKQQLADYVREHDIVLNEVEKDNRYGDSVTRFGPEEAPELSLPGGTNYRELLLTAPLRKEPNGRFVVTDGSPNFNMAVNTRSEAENIVRNLQGHSTRPLQIVDDMAVPDHLQFQSSHWDEPNPIAHLRMNDRNIPLESTPEQTAAAQAHSAAGLQLAYLRAEQQAVSREISATARPIEEARQQQIIADNKAGKLSNVEAMKALEAYVPPPEIKPLQDRLEAIRKEENSIRDGLPPLPGEQSLKSLHLEELQSDWHQKGRKAGYRKGNGYAIGDRQRVIEKRLDEIKDTAPPDIRNSAVQSREWAEKNVPEYVTLRDELFANQAAEFAERKAVPDAPFKQSWPDLLLKRAIVKAAHEGYDSISWTPGEHQAARYDLSKKISEVRFEKSGNSGFTRREDIESNDSGRLVAYDHDGRVVINEYVPATELPDYIGKDAAEKLLEPKGDYFTHAGTATVGRSLSGLDLKVGGEGMKAFYDKMLVDKANALGKKFGAKVEWKELPATVKKTLTGYGKTNPAVRVPVLRLTPKLKEFVLKNGLPKFAAGGSVNDDYNHRLSPDDEQSFQSWKSQNAPRDGGADYDLRGAYLAGVTPAAKGHWPDRFKKPNHPTFSDQSENAKYYPEKAGHWDGETFIPPGMASGGVADAPAEPSSQPGRFIPVEYDPFNSEPPVPQASPASGLGIQPTDIMQMLRDRSEDQVLQTPVDEIIRSAGRLIDPSHDPNSAVQRAMSFPF